MTSRRRTIITIAGALAGHRPVWVGWCVLIFSITASVSAQPAQAIPADEIVALQEALAQVAQERSATEARRACKRVVREAQAMIETSPDAPNRFDVVAVLFQAQKRLVALESNERNREAIFETCRVLIDAPDSYAALRFEADMLLSEKDLAEREATLEERAAALEQILNRYRGTVAEWQSLKIASLIAPKLLAFDLEQRIQDQIAERFGADHQAIAFRHKQASVGELEVVFSGRYERATGGPLVFPNDRIGHQYLVVFWSTDTPNHQVFLQQVKEQVDRFPGRFEVYSFNVDELPDAGQGVLDSVGLEATAMRLPGGRNHSAYQAYARMHPLAMLVNVQGQVRVQPGVARPWPGPTPARGKQPASPGPGIGLYLDDARFLTQLQYLSIGEFLIGTPTAGDPKLLADLKAIDDCFVEPPIRYRMTAEQSLAAYTKIETLCSTAIRTHAGKPDVWQLKNRRIIARLGLWNLTTDAGHLHAAVQDAETVLTMDLPADADLVARYCLGVKKLREPQTDPEKLVAEFIRKVDGAETSASARAAAAMLAWQANARTSFQNLRQQMLKTPIDSPEPNLQPVYTFLRDKHHQYRSFHATPGGYGYNRPQKYQFRFMVGGYTESIPDHRQPTFALTTLDGRTIRIPQDAAGEMLGIIFVEPPSDRDAVRELMKQASEFADIYRKHEVRVIVAFIADQSSAVRQLVEGSEFAFESAMLSDGLASPVVQQLGILSADRTPNPLLLRPDGTVAWQVSGLDYHAFGNNDYAMSRAIESNIEKVRSDRAFQALEQGEFKKAIALFDERLPPERERDWWTADRYHGRALARISLGQFAEALTDVEAAINQRKADFKGGICKCHGLVEMYLTKAMVFEKLGRGREAAEQRRLADQENTPHAILPPGVARDGVPVGVYYDWLKRIRHDLVSRGDLK